MWSERATKRLTDEGCGAVSSPPPPPAFLHHSGSIATPPHNSHRHQNSNNQGKLLDQFRAALDQKEAQIEILRLRSDGLLKSLRLKDLDVQHLQQAVEDRDLALISREKLIDQTKQRLLFQRKSEKAEIEKKDLEIAFLKAKSIRQHNKLTEQSNLLSTLHNQKEKMQQDVYAYSQHVKKKVHKLKENLQFALASIQQKDEELELQSKCIDDLKADIWKKERLLQDIKTEQEKLQYNLDRKDMVCKQLQLQNEKLKDENLKIEKSLGDLKQEFQRDSSMQVSYLQRQKNQIQRLETALSKVESLFHANNLELQACNAEKIRLLKEHELLNTKYDSMSQDHVQLQMKLMDLEEQMNITQNEAGKPVDFLTYFSGEHCRSDRSAKQLNFENPSLTAPEPSTFAEDYYKHQRCVTNYSSDKKLPISNRRQYDGQSNSAIIDDIPVDLARIEKNDSQLSETDNTPFMLIGSTVTPRLLNVDANVAGTGAFHSSCFSELNLNIDANGDRVKTKIDSNGTVDNLHSSASLELQKIQEEIKNREKSWKQIEARMRAELNRRASQFHEAEKGSWSLFTK